MATEEKTSESGVFRKIVKKLENMGVDESAATEIFSQAKQLQRTLKNIDPIGLDAAFDRIVSSPEFMAKFEKSPIKPILAKIEEIQTDTEESISPPHTPKKQSVAMMVPQTPAQALPRMRFNPVEAASPFSFGGQSTGSDEKVEETPAFAQANMYAPRTSPNQRNWVEFKASRERYEPFQSKYTTAKRKVRAAYDWDNTDWDAFFTTEIRDRPVSRREIRKSKLRYGMMSAPQGIITI